MAELSNLDIVWSNLIVRVIFILLFAQNMFLDTLNDSIWINYSLRVYSLIDRTSCGPLTPRAQRWRMRMINHLCVQHCHVDRYETLYYFLNLDSLKGKAKNTIAFRYLFASIYEEWYPVCSPCIPVLPSPFINHIILRYLYFFPIYFLSDKLYFTFILTWFTSNDFL